MFQIIAIGFTFLVVLLVSSCGVEIVDSGNSGVKKVLGKVQEETLPPGLYLTNPFTTTVIEVNNQTQRMEGISPSYTRDVQQASVSYVLNYNLNAAASASIYVNVGNDWQNILIPQVINGSIKNVIGKWNAIDLVANRDKASNEIEAQIRTGLLRHGITVTKLELVNIDYADQFEQAVEAKVVAVQRAEEAKNQTVQVKEQADQRIIAAKADAEAMRIKTEALKQSQDLVLYEAVQKWNGVLPQTIMGSATPMVNFKLPGQQ